MNSSDNKKQNLGMIMIAVLLIGVGFASGWLSFLMFGDIAGNCEVMFVSKEAIIKLEEERVKAGIKEDPSNVQTNSIFFGKVKEALGLIERMARSFEDKRTKVLFINNDSGSVRGGQEASDVVHAEVIKALDKHKKTNE
jgi:hypothetical protein